MKCPKCGFNSFEYYDSCKKCSADLIGYKQTYAISPLVLPLEAKEQLAEEFRSSESEADHSAETAETHDDIFSFDLPDDSSSSGGGLADDPFNFNDPAPETTRAGSQAAEEDVFANLLESTSQTDDSPFGAAPAAPSAHAAPAAGPGEFDLENFSWDDTPAVAAPPATPATSDTALDDFDSLFGDSPEDGSK